MFNKSELATIKLALAAFQDALPETDTSKLFQQEPNAIINQSMLNALEAKAEFLAQLPEGVQPFELKDVNGETDDVISGFIQQNKSQLSFSLLGYNGVNSVCDINCAMLIENDGGTPNGRVYAKAASDDPSSIHDFSVVRN